MDALTFPMGIGDAHLALGIALLDGCGGVVHARPRTLGAKGGDLHARTRVADEVHGGAAETEGSLGAGWRLGACEAGGVSPPQGTCGPPACHGPQQFAGPAGRRLAYLAHSPWQTQVFEIVVEVLSLHEPPIASEIFATGLVLSVVPGSAVSVTAVPGH